MSAQFRHEALHAQSEHCSGRPISVMPPSWRLLTGMFAAIAGATLVFLATATFSRKESAAGLLKLSQGALRVLPTRPGIIKDGSRLAAIHDGIMAFPMQYNSLVGDMGTILSSGQKQRVLIARALYRRPRILVMDDGTAHLDPAREEQIHAMLRAMMRAADRVVELRGGALREVRLDGPIALPSPALPAFAPQEKVAG